MHIQQASRSHVGGFARFYAQFHRQFCYLHLDGRSQVDCLTPHRSLQRFQVGLTLSAVSPSHRDRKKELPPVITVLNQAMLPEDCFLFLCKIGCLVYQGTQILGERPALRGGCITEREHPMLRGLGT